jgi:glyoxylase-like metal-dependent hydrolase (beta-lactamase superfamily II)
MGDYFESLEALIEKAPKAIIPSHGMPAGGVHLLRRTLNHRRMREEQVQSFSLAGRNQEEIVAAIYREVDERLLPLAAQNVRQHLRKLRAEGRIG